MDSNLFWCIVGIAGGAAISFIISLTFYIIGLKRKSLSYKIETSCLISEQTKQLTGLNISFNSDKIDSLYLSTIVIKNTGNTIIEQQDFELGFPIEISTNGQFFIHEKGYALPSKNVHELFDDLTIKEKMCKHVTLHFDYIPKKGVLSCTLYHTGDIHIDSKLKDGKMKDEKALSTQSKILTIFSIIAFVISIMSLLYSIYS